MKRAASGTFSVVSRQWSRRGGAMPTRSIGIGGGLNSGRPLPTFSILA